MPAAPRAEPAPGRRARAPSGGRASVRASSSSPSSTRSGDSRSRTASLWLSGSPSMALPTTTGRRPSSAASFRAVGKPAPPRPVSPASVSRSIRLRVSSRGIGPAGAAPSSRRSPVGGAPGPEVVICVVTGTPAGGAGDQPRSPNDTDVRHASATADHGDAGQADGLEPARGRVGAGAERVHESDRPQGVGRPVHRSEHPRPDVLAQQAHAGHHQQQVDGHGAEPEPERSGSCPGTAAPCRRPGAARRGRRAGSPGAPARARRRSARRSGAARRGRSAPVRGCSRPERPTMPRASGDGEDRPGPRCRCRARGPRVRP